MAELPDAVQEQVEKIAATTKKGFDLKARLEGRGLRKSTIKLFLDEEKGVELGWAYDLVDTLGNVTGREREGVIGEIDALEEARRIIIDQRAEANKVSKPDEQVDIDAPTPLDMEIIDLTEKRDKLVEELTGTALVVGMRAVPPVILKNTRRLARETVGITEKGIPEDKAEAFNDAAVAHLMSVMFHTIVDNATGTVNDGVTYEDAVALRDYLPPGQWARLDLEMGKVQYTDAISREIEGQEDFS